MRPDLCLPVPASPSHSSSLSLVVRLLPRLRVELGRGDEDYVFRSKGSASDGVGDLAKRDSISSLVSSLGGGRF